MKLISIKEVFTNAWALWRTHWMFWAGVGVVNVAIIVGIQIASGGSLLQAQSFLSSFVSAWQMSGAVFLGVMSIIVSFGMMHVALRAVSGDKPTWKSMGLQGRFFVWWILAMIISNVPSMISIFFLFLLPVFSPASFDNPVGFVMRTMYALPFVYLWVRFQFAPLATLDGLGFGAALKTSWRMTKGNVIWLVFFTLALLVFVESMRFIASLPTFVSTFIPPTNTLLAFRVALTVFGTITALVVSIMFVAPFSLLALSLVYRKLCGKPADKTKIG